jgi:diguanylate cyclase (GGDEF)-like protein/PAS domain S-box-containing protein
MRPRHVDDVDALLKPQREALAALLRSDALGEDDARRAIAEIVEVAARTLHVDRVGVWRVDDDHRALHLVDLFEQRAGKHTRDLRLSASDCPQYFDALMQQRSIAAHDARHDPRTREFREKYLEPNGIMSMLDAPIIVRGQLRGVICHEHVGPRRKWTAWEELVAATFADFISMIFAAEELIRFQHDDLHRLFEASPVALVLTRANDQTVAEANERAATLFGVPRADVKGKRAPDYWVNAEDRTALLSKIAATGRVDSHIAELKRADGSRFWGDVSAQLITFAGRPSLLVGVRDITQLHELATMDALTGVANRRRFFEIAEDEVLRADRYGGPLSLAMIDADHFKAINDRLGHAEGDAALQFIAKVLREGLRRSDTVGRYGGEEFCVLLPATALESALEVIDELRLGIALGGRVTVSAGVIERKEGEALASMLKRADDALYKAKAEGRNRVISSG